MVSKLSQGSLAGVGLCEKVVTVGKWEQVFSTVMGEGMNGYGSVRCGLM
jgi:hypothetical protein